MTSVSFDPVRWQSFPDHIGHQGEQMLRSQGRFAEMRAKNGDLHHILFFQFTEGQPGNGAVTELIEGKDQADACAVLNKLVDVSGRSG